MVLVGAVKRARVADSIEFQNTQKEPAPSSSKILKKMVVPEYGQP
jgi:hypothetical protein